MSCQAAISGKFQNMLLQKAKAPYMLLSVVETVMHMAWIVVINAWSTMFCASVKFCSGLLTAM
jgi:hypothetical protein